MTEQELLQAVDAASAGIEAMQGNVLGAIAQQTSGWFAVRIKVAKGGVKTVQVTTDVEIVSTIEPEKRRRGRKSD